MYLYSAGSTRIPGRLSGPLLDRIDIQVDVPTVRYDDMVNESASESSAEIRKRVNMARNIQRKRFLHTGIYCNAQMTSPMVRKYCRLGKEESDLLRNAFSSLGLTARSHDKILKVARTIADLDGSENITAIHISEAIQYRILDRNLYR